MDYQIRLSLSARRDLEDMNAEGVNYFQPSGWSAATTLGTQNHSSTTLKAFANAFSVRFGSLTKPKVETTRGLELANAGGVGIGNSEILSGIV